MHVAAHAAARQPRQRVPERVSLPHRIVSYRIVYIYIYVCIPAGYVSHVYLCPCRRALEKAIELAIEMAIELAIEKAIQKAVEKVIDSTRPGARCALPAVKTLNPYP